VGTFDLLSLGSDLIIVYFALAALMFYMRGQKQKKRAAALELIKRWNDNNYQEVLNDVLFDPKNSNRDIRKILRDSATSYEKEESHRKLYRVWDFFEEISIAIMFNEVDEDVAKEFFFYNLIETYRLSEKAFQQLRSQQNNIALYANFERVLGKWAASKEYTIVREVSR
jgi:hypothetical protein